MLSCKIEDMNTYVRNEGSNVTILKAKEHYARSSRF